MRVRLGEKVFVEKKKDEREKMVESGQVFFSALVRGEDKFFGEERRE